MVEALFTRGVLAQSKYRSRMLLHDLLLVAPHFNGDGCKSNIGRPSCFPVGTFLERHFEVYVRSEGIDLHETIHLKR